MPSEAQLSANRRNAKLSTGARTQAGRACSAMNACKSGIYAKSEIIPGEDPAELEALKTRIYDSLQPSPEEGPVVDQLIGADWQFRRLRRAEADLWTMSMTVDREANRKKGLPEDTHIYYRAIEDNKETFERIYRFQASTARILNRSLDTLLHIRKLDLLQSPHQNEPNLPSPSPEPPATENDETNPIPEPVAPAASAGDETNPIPEAPVPSPQPPTPDSDKTNPIPEPVAPAASAGDETNPISKPRSGDTATDPRPLIPAHRLSPAPGSRQPTPVPGPLV
jgi:hypothetical protein